MTELITLVIATGARPESYARCEHYIRQQTVKIPIEVIVVDDYPQEPTKVTLPNAMRVAGPKPWRPGINTQRPNLDAALPYINGSMIAVVEDDDCVMPDYLETMARLLKNYSAVGEGNSVYYNIKTRQWREWKNYGHCSLCQTAFRKELLPRFEEAVNSGELFMDMALWRIFYTHKLKPFIFLNQNLVVGIKGMPGRHGIGAGHDPDATFASDPGFTKLYELVGKENGDYYKGVALRESAAAATAIANVMSTRKRLTPPTRNDRMRV